MFVCSLRDKAQVEQLLRYVVEEPLEEDDADSKRAFKYYLLPFYLLNVSGNALFLTSDGFLGIRLSLVRYSLVKLRLFLRLWWRTTRFFFLFPKLFRFIWI